MSSFEIDYEEDLISRIQDLIDGYDKDSILKEYLQNADDSGATELIVTYDKQNYLNLQETDYQPASNSSLLIYNNSKFRPIDFEKIVIISAKGKRDDANSTGRFGQGFSSSFSISDHPSFISNGRAYWFDVLRKAVSKEKLKKRIQGWSEKDFDEIKLWLNTFKVAGLKEDFQGTIFRLPLRNENTSKTSEISNEIFTFQDFLKWVDEWKNSSDKLLFLRHIHRFVLQEIDETGKKIIHLDIKTENKDKIEKINNSIQNEFDGKLLEICEKWGENELQLPLFKYNHKFKIDYLDRTTNKYVEEKKTWAVVNGLFRGENNSLIEYAKKVLTITPNPRKVLPWAGVAVELDVKNKPIKNESMLFTFLPLPIKSKYPVHIHGWFDLNPKRTEITSSGSGHDKETLVQWNELLLKEGVGKAWALLIDYLKIEKSSHYSFWAKDTEFELNDKVNKGFYKSISELNCLYVIYKDKEEWKSPKEVDLHYFKDEKNQVLLNAFKEHFSIISPKPQNFIIENFKNIDIKLTEVTNQYIRGYLIEESKTIKFPIAFDGISIFMLSKKEWLLEILKYCADNGEDYSLINGLPLELTLNNDIYNIDSDTLFDEDPNLKLFQDMRYLYIDVDIVNSIDNTDSLPSSWLKPTLLNKIRLLSRPDYWKNLEISKEWLEEIIHLIVNSSKEEFDEAKNIITELQLVYQENREYGKLQSDIKNYSPYMPKDEDIENNLIYLKKIEMNVVHHDYIDIYKPFLKYNGFITELTSKTLAEHLLQLDDFSFFEDKDTREYLLNILTEDITWFDELNVYKLNFIAFIQTVNDNLYSQDTDVKLFLPTDFTPPEHIQSLKGEYELIAVDTKSNLFALYKEMEIEEQGLGNYIQEVIIPFLENNQNLSDNKEVLKWLISKWNSIKKMIDSNIFDKLKDASIIPSFLNEESSYKASELYLPTIKLPNILNDNKFKPICFDDKKVEDTWILFLKDLGSSEVVLSQHIENRVNQIVENNNQKDAISLLNYIANNFEIFEEMNILDTLKEYAWYPVEKSNDILKPKNEYTELKRSDELILFDDLNIAGGYYHILDRRVNLGKKDEKGNYTEKDMPEKLGIIINIPNESFFESFRELIKLSPQNGQVVNYTKEIYKYIGRRFKGETIDFDIEERTILINNQWIAPKYVYQHQIHLTGIHSWYSLVGNEIESSLAKGLISLGIQDKPTFDFFIEQLQNLPQEQDLDSNQLRDAKALLHEIQNKDENLFYHNELPILTGNNQLVLSSNLYINDLPAYKNAEDKNKNLLFVYYQFERILARRLGVISLNENLSPAIYSYKECESSFKIDEILKKDSFKEVILRLLYHEKKIEEDEINEEKLDNILPSQIIFTNQLIIEYSIHETFLYRSNETTYEDKNENCLYIFEQDDNEDMIEAITEYICNAMSLDKYNLLIARILRETMNKSQIDTFLEKKKIKPLPQSFDIEEEISIFDNTHLVKLNEKVTYDDSTNQEENYVEKNSESKGEIAPPTKPKASHENTNTNNTSNSNNTTGGGSKSFSSNASLNKSNKKTVSSNDRKPVYVGKEKEVDEEKQQIRRESAKEIGDKGENYVLANKGTLVLSKTNDFQKAPTNNKGFDIYEKDMSGQTIRYIEIKTLTGPWAEGGVGITKHQLDFAQKQKDKWWLFVVENINTDNTKVYQFKNPILEANRFMFDNSWKQLSYQSKKIENQEPKVNDRYELTFNRKKEICTIMEVNSQKVILKIESTEEIKKKIFNQSWKKL